MYVESRRTSMIESILVAFLEASYWITPVITCKEKFRRIWATDNQVENTVPVRTNKNADLLPLNSPSCVSAQFVPSPLNLLQSECYAFFISVLIYPCLRDLIHTQILRSIGGRLRNSVCGSSILTSCGSAIRGIGIEIICHLCIQFICRLGLWTTSISATASTATSCLTSSSRTICRGFGSCRFRLAKMCKLKPRIALRKLLTSFDHLMLWLWEVV